VQSLRTGERRLLVDGVDPHCIADGRLVFARGGVVFGVGSDADRLELHGTPVPVLEGVRRSSLGGDTGSGQYAISQAGTLGSRSSIWIYDVAGNTTIRRLTFDANNRYPVWSNDSMRVAFQSDRGGTPSITVGSRLHRFEPL